MTYVISKIHSRYISCACNRTPHAADWGNNGLICYGACNAVAIYDPKANGGGKVQDTLTGHKGRVNATKWVKSETFAAETELVSVSTDTYGLIWSKREDSFVVTDVLKGHESSVTVVDAIYVTKPGATPTLLIVTGSVDSTVRIWERQHEEAAVCRQVLSLDSGVCVSLSILLPHPSTPLLACALDDCHIHLYGQAADTDTFTRLQSLKGHEDWVTALHFTTEDNGDLLLASGSQDSSVRLWRFHPTSSQRSTDGSSLPPMFRVEEKMLRLGSMELAVSLESVLLGHDGRVYGVKWHPPVLTDTGYTQPLKLLTASLDKTVVVWAPEAQSGVWLEEARMGEVGGNTLGFFGASFGPSGSAILAHSYLGGFHLWYKDEDEWRPTVVVGGHFDAVTDLAWERKHGRYLLTVSTDQTTRLHAPWVQSDCDKKYSWHEIARPQIHGYDLVCLAMLPNFRFVSGADEKVVRAFTAPQNFLENFKRLCLKNTKDVESDDKLVSLPTGAAVPVLGLSNKAVFQHEPVSQPEERHVKDQYDESSYFTPQQFEEPPTEDNLLQNTLWPETMKLYGHGYEIFSLATTSDGKLLASACKATNEEHAAVLLWDTTTWQKVDRLVYHQLTVTQLEFSPDDQYLLSVSRDRCWAVFQRSESEVDKYSLVARSNKGTGVHTRIIWCCAWTHDSAHFVTGSRDGKVVVWDKIEHSHPTLGNFAGCSEYLDLPKESITSVACGADFYLFTNEYLMAVGSEAGDIRLYGWENLQSPWRFLFQLSGNSAHHLTVKRLSFRPVLGIAGQAEDSASKQTECILQLASCGLDHTIKIFDLYIK
ncbi:probable elongator complex protein 2 [Homalodisca vitripennis]|uniref:probable elongator complex protein 2 n=1 Tax=Homalodisca vitripennis TaxID=197043 RepID=UPI001EEC440B|nr:probable elongator complex protein 2 [Homalodisca vitripennis]